MESECNNIVVRPAKAEESSALARIGEDSLGMFGRHDVRFKFNACSFSGQLSYETPEQVIVVVDEDQIIAGFCRMKIYAQDLRLHEIFVAPSHNRMGMGTRLLNYAFSQASDLGLESIVLLTGAGGKWTVPFYRKHGFVIPEEQDLPESLRSDLAAARENKVVASVPGYGPVIAMQRRLK